MVLLRAHRCCSFERESLRSPPRCSILHLRRPMSKLCTSDLFSISLAEFYSSNNLELSKSTLNQCENRPVLKFCEFSNLDIDCDKNVSHLVRRTLKKKTRFALF